MSEWLNNLKVGDEVIIRFAGVGGFATFSIVERLTKTLIITKGGKKFRGRDGHSLAGDSFTFHFLQEPTQEERDNIRKTRLVNLIMKTDKTRFNFLSLEKLEAIWDEIIS